MEVCVSWKKCWLLGCCMKILLVSDVTRDFALKFVMSTRGFEEPHMDTCWWSLVLFGVDFIRTAFQSFRLIWSFFKWSTPLIKYDVTKLRSNKILVLKKRGSKITISPQIALFKIWRSWDWRVQSIYFFISCTCVIWIFTCSLVRIFFIDDGLIAKLAEAYQMLVPVAFKMGNQDG